MTDGGGGQSERGSAISNTLYLESDYIIEAQKRKGEGGTSAGTQFVVQKRDNENISVDSGG